MDHQVSSEQEVSRALQVEAEARMYQQQTQKLHFGERSVVAMQRVIKGASFYKRSNPIFIRLVQEALLTLHADMKNAGTDYLILKVVQDACFCNNRRIRVSAETLHTYKALIHAMRLHWIGQIEINCGVTLEELIDFAFCFEALEEHNEKNAMLMSQEFLRYNIVNIRVSELDTNEGELGLRDSEALKRKSKQVYFSTIGVIKELMLSEKNAGEIDVRKAKRLMMNAVNLIMRDESSLLGLANIKSYDDYTFCHSVNVAIYAVAIGQRLGLPKLHLYYLGVCGLFHDIGKMYIPREILNKPAALTPEEWQVIRNHPIRGAETVLRQKGWGDLASRMLASTLEHHARFDLTGYPTLTATRKASLFSRIITIADCYDALGRPRVYRRTPYVSEKILGMMLAQSGKDFDPLLVKVFINMIGVYPLGALVLLNTNELGIVSKISEVPELVLHPQVCLLKKHNGEYIKNEVVDLAETDADGTFPRQIVETLDPNDYNISVEEFFL